MPNTARTQPQKKNSVKFRLIVSAIILLILALGFNALLSLNSLEKLYVESIASQYSAGGRDLQRNIESALRFGKSLEKFIGMEKLLLEAKENITQKIHIVSTVDGSAPSSETAPDISVSIVLPDGSIPYSTDDALVGSLVPEQVRVDYGTSLTDPAGYVKYGDTYITPIPIVDMRKNWLATEVIMFGDAQVKALLNYIRTKDITNISFILIGSSILLTILLNILTPSETSRIDIFPKWRISIAMFLVIVSAQIIFASLNVNNFKDYYIRISKEKTKMLVNLLKEDIDFFLSKGIRIDKLVKMDVLLGEIIADSPELNDIMILDKEGAPLYMATKSGVVDFQHAGEDERHTAQRILQAVDPQYSFRLDLVKNNRVDGQIIVNADPEGYIFTNLSKGQVREKVIEIALNSATILVISMLLFGELLILIFQFIEDQAIDAKSLGIISYTTIRPIAFLFFFGIDICISFLPLHMEALYEPILGLSKNIILGLPISMQMLTTGISILVAGAWVDRRGWHEPFLAGLILSSGGFFYAWLAPNAWHFIVSLGLVGFGYGFSYMASQGFVIAYTTSATKAQGLAQLYAGCLAGSICGGAAGAMLAERIGYPPVFLVGSGMLIFVILFTSMTMRRAFHKTERHKHEAARQSKGTAKIVRVFHFLSDRRVLGVLLFSSLPASVAVVGFLNYFSPIYLKQIGTSQSNIGRILMVYGLCIIYIAPVISKKIGAAKRPQRYIFFSGLLGSLAFLSFSLLGGIALAVAATVLLLGISGSFNAFRNGYVINLESSQRLGEGTAMGLLFSISRLGQVAGPLVFGWLLTLGVTKGLSSFALTYLLCSFLLLLFTYERKKISEKEG